MTRYDDNRKAGRSETIPFIEGERACDRHQRKKDTNLGKLPEIFEWCKEQGLLLKVLNEGYHWVFKKKDWFVADWWPSSAKLVIGRQWDKGIHCHDHNQVQRKILEAVKIKQTSEVMTRTKGSPPG